MAPDTGISEFPTYQPAGQGCCVARAKNDTNGYSFSSVAITLLFLRAFPNDRQEIRLLFFAVIAPKQKTRLGSSSEPRLADSTSITLNVEGLSFAASPPDHGRKLSRRCEYFRQSVRLQLLRDRGRSRLQFVRRWLGVFPQQAGELKDSTN